MAECFLCKHPKAQKEINQQSRWIINYDCPVCGSYQIGRDIIQDVETSSFIQINNNRMKNDEFREMASIIAAELKLQGMDQYLLLYDHKHNELKHNSDYTTNFFPSIGLSDFLSKRPINPIEIFDKTMLNLSRMIKKHYDEYILKKVPEAYIGECAYFYSPSFDKVIITCDFLRGLELISIRKDTLPSELRIKITSKGWQKIAELENAKAFKNSDKAFLAMWFNEETDVLYDAVRKALEQAGYCPEGIRVDDTHHNDFIMNKVINMINDARFVIADFTCTKEDTKDKKVKNGVRGGVYFEAGYARGQNKEVIHTCRDDDESKKRMHFDTEQIYRITWNPSNMDKFIEDLRNQILVTVGKGPHFKSN